MLTYLFFTGYFYGSYLGLEKYMPEYFPDSNGIVTRKYRIVNAVKSLALAGLCIPGSIFIYNLVYYPETVTFNDSNWIGAIYTATDASALLYNRNCHKSTLFHHIVVQLFYYYCYFMNFHMVNGLSRAIGLYCVYSSWAFLVNLRLSIRYLDYPKTEYYINEAALYTYITSCTINWVTQLYLMIFVLNINYFINILYLLALSMTIRDDLFLIRFLRKIEYNKKEDLKIKEN